MIWNNLTCKETYRDAVKEGGGYPVDSNPIMSGSSDTSLADEERDSCVGYLAGCGYMMERCGTSVETATDGGYDDLDGKECGHYSEN